MTGPFRRLVGVDFSGARDAGNRIWIAEGSPQNGRLVLDRLHRARDLPGGGAARTPALAALRAYLADQVGALVGLDFPFGLPEALVEEPDWRAFADGFARRHADAGSFRNSCRRRSDGREWKRRTDREAKTPFAAYNLRLYRQTYWGIAGVLAPLLAADRTDRVAIAPVLMRPGASVTLAEVCPASSLKRLGCYGPYKGYGGRRRMAREAILGRLVLEGLSVNGEMAEIIAADIGGDALDAVVAAATGWRLAGSSIADLEPRDAIDALEARVYAWPVDGMD